MRRSGALVGAVVALAVVAARPSPVAAAQAPLASPAVLLILDASGSMNGDDGSGRPKLAAAKQALTDVVAGLPAEAVVGLRVYGHRVPNTDKANGCNDTELVAPVAPLDRPRLSSAIAGFSARGFTPIGRSLQAAVTDLPAGGERTVVLVSDGIDTCAPPDPCQVARDLAASGVGLRIETVGFQVDAAAADQLRCIAQATGGSYLDAPDAAALSSGLVKVTARAFRFYIATGEPAQGTPEPAGAPALEPGTDYRDTIRDGQSKWYGVEVAAGQRVDVRATLVGPPASLQIFSSTGRWRLGLVDPLGNEESFSSTLAGQGVESVHTGGGSVRADGSSPSGRPPGTWTVRVSFEGANPELVGRDLPVELGVRLTPPAAIAVPAERSAVAPTGGAAAPAPPGDGGGGWTTGAAVAVCAALALVGAALGARLAARSGR